jgi:hypothetical protein
MRKALFLLAFVVGGVAFALTVGSKAASASVLPPLLGQEQTATNSNSTTQDAAAEATTKQANVNLPISVLSWGSNGGDVDQSNSADTEASAANENDTKQAVDQDQQAGAGSRGTSHAPQPAGTGIDQRQSGTNDNSTEQGAEATAATRQLNVNAPISVLSWGANGGDVDQSNDATTKAGAENTNGTDQKVDQDQTAVSNGGGGAIAQSQDATNGNETSQQAAADATTKQANVNAPISILSWSSGGTGCDCEKRSDGVEQSNRADTKAFSGNANWTDQRVDQDQAATVAVPHTPARGHGEYPKPHQPHKPGPKPCGCDGPKGHVPGPSIDQSQDGANHNATEQRAGAEATTKQANVNLPVSVLSWGANGGDVDQANHARTTANAGNANATDQSVDQAQQATIADGGSKPARPHSPTRKSRDRCACSHPKPVHPKPVRSQPASIEQSQDGGNRNDTKQQADADAATEQKNVNVPFSFFTWGGSKDGCGCGHAKGSDHRDGGVDQANGARTTAWAGNANQTRQTIDHMQEALIGRR